MESLINIAQSWLNLAQDDPELKQLAEKRLSICDTCEMKRQLSHTGAWLVTRLNEKNSIYYCGECGCPLAALTIRPGNQCALSKWLSEEAAY